MSDKKITHAFGWQLDRGMKRANNEDSLGAAKIKQAGADDSRSIGVYVVADGVGGSEGGEQASKFAVETALNKMLAHIAGYASEEDIMRWLLSAAKLAHRLIRQRKANDEEIGSTTLVLAAVVEDRVHIVNIGDSRAYLIAAGKMRQITHDHTVTQHFLDAGIISEAEALEHPFRHVLSQAVGSKSEVMPDVFSESVCPGDYLLLCTDGLYNTVKETDIVRLVLKAKTPQQASEALTQAANQGGGEDNIAVVVVAIGKR